MRYGMFLFAVLLLCLGCGTPAPAQKPAVTPTETTAPKLEIPPEYRDAYAIRPGMPKEAVLALLSARGIAYHKAWLEVENEYEWPPTGFLINGDSFVLFFAEAKKDSKQALISIDWIRTVDETVEACKTNWQSVSMSEFVLPKRK